MSVLFTKCFEDLESYKEYTLDTSVSVTNNFRSEYSKHLEAASIVVDCAKIYILENYEKVKDWSDLDVTVESGTDLATGRTHFYKHTDFGENNKYGLFNQYNEESKKNEIICKSLTNVVLDPTDGDFSLTINEKEFWWIFQNAIITIANYIETSLIKNETK